VTFKQEEGINVPDLDFHLPRKGLYNIFGCPFRTNRGRRNFFIEKSLPTILLRCPLLLPPEKFYSTFLRGFVKAPSLWGFFPGKLSCGLKRVFAEHLFPKVIWGTLIISLTSFCQGFSHKRFVEKKPGGVLDTFKAPGTTILGFSNSWQHLL